MKRYLILLAFIFCVLFSSAQYTETFFNKGLDLAQVGKFEKALAMMDKSIAKDSTVSIVWHFKGVLQMEMYDYENALVSLTRAAKLNPYFKNTWLYSGIVKKYLTDYEGAVADFTKAISYDLSYGDAYYNRGMVYEKIYLRDAACADYLQAKLNGVENMDRKIDECNEPDFKEKQYNSILRLTQKAESKAYGYSENDPIKVGKGAFGGPANQRDYLNLLRDVHGKTISYKRLGSCCPYQSENAFLGGNALLDKYEITFLDEKGNKKTTIVYISFYDYEEPKIIFGFGTVGQK